MMTLFTGVDDEFDDCPLEEKHLEKLNANCRQLVVRMDLGDGLLDDMLCCGCITWEQRDTIKELNASTAEKKRKMIDILTRRSVAHYKTFLACLCRDGQTDLADILAVDEGKIILFYNVILFVINYRIMSKYSPHK